MSGIGGKRRRGTGIDAVATLMTEKGYHSIPVVYGGAIVGIIGMRDLLATLLKK